MSKKLILDLQLFAEPNMNVQTTAAAELSPEMKKFYSKQLIELASANLVHAQFGDKVSIPKGSGKTIEWRQFSSLPKATTPLVEGTTPDGVPIKVTSITQTLEEFGAYTAITDVLELTAIDPVLTEITAKHADSMGLTLDTIVRDEINTGTNVIYADFNGQRASLRSELTAEHKLNLKTIAMAKTYLKKQNAPKFDGSYVCLIHPSVTFDITTDENWIDIQKYSNVTNIFEGEIGKLYGVRFVESTEAAIFSGEEGGADGCAVYSCLFIGKGAYKVIDVGGSGAVIIVKSKGSAGTADPLEQRSTVGWKIPQFGAKIVIPQYLVRVECGSSFSDIDIAA